MVVHSHHWYYSLEKISSQISLSSFSLHHSRLTFPNAFRGSSWSLLFFEADSSSLDTALLPVFCVKWPHCLRYLHLKPKSFVLAHIFSFYSFYIRFGTTGSLCSFTISLCPMPVNTALVRALFFFPRPDAFHFLLLLILCLSSVHILLQNKSHLWSYFCAHKLSVTPHCLLNKVWKSWQWHFGALYFFLFFFFNLPLSNLLSLGYLGGSVS